MEIRNLKQAEELLIGTTQNEAIIDHINEEIGSWNLPNHDDYPDLVSKITDLFYKLYVKVSPDQNNHSKFEALQWILFDKIHDLVVPCIKAKFFREDESFFDRCSFLCKTNVSAKEFGADDNYSIPLCAAVVELSVIDKYKSPNEKMNCLCSTYDLVFAEIKTAMVSVISEKSDKEIEIPIIDNKDIMPVLMAVIFRSKLPYMLSNLFYIKFFCFKIEENREIFDIFKAFESAVDKLIELDIDTMEPMKGLFQRSLDLEEYIKITSNSKEEKVKKSTLIDKANQRVLNLITRSTSEDQLF
ncbi:ankyrin repeat domain-containing protein 27-like [Tribolium madens]|uniref:ankyrin repeat domain-containing protein 27-like n=1 Tax=Tribolium madens TaxID=41895 RepID=UPI001CF73DC6|nr:ankyrin repeat domain-containing protein 27-like [Tribolium madens]XP_044271736.1 ankyrin repeat domain-containing protein 27-like [Tribolium madens]